MDSNMLPPSPTVNAAGFAVGIWHPFGPHGGESVEDIIKRKSREIEVNGWTLWSFQHRRSETLELWYRELAFSRVTHPMVFCSDSKGAVDPADIICSSVRVTNCRSFRFIGTGAAWQPLPSGVNVPHPFRGEKKRATAFMIQRIVYPAAQLALPAIEWLSKGQWRQDRLPGRGEYLIRPGGTLPMRPVRALLELRSPYLAVVSTEEP
ncbi:MAG TPA: hypothetical protein VHQ90_03705 [Thermoanaerobaculia bacterium]|nr:hypothetical protein [Thermoanaerobaculia bacterium]